MVSLNTILAIGGVGAAYLIFKSLGGASGIGSSIGRGASQFSESIVSGLTGNIIPNFDNPLNTSTPEGFRLDPNRSKQTYDDYINYKDDGSPPTSPAEPDEDGYTPFIFNPPANAAPATAPMFQYNSSNFFEQTPIEERFSNKRTATRNEKNYLRSYGIGG
tara:strand:- start:962 stop:1444 length:483 start_codon:yes stop_codon:yes gene_type:complete